MYRIPLAVAIISMLVSCDSDDAELALANREQKVEQLLKVSQRINPEPEEWSDEDLQALSTIGTSDIVGLGEATHGTSEFFRAKTRIFQYLVENHNFQVFAFEADFGESIPINEAIQESRTEDLRSLMIEYMHFWTWKNEEVLELLVWMSEYNRDKADSEKLQYIGVDCQFNTYNPSYAKDYLSNIDPVHFESEILLLKEIEHDFIEGNGHEYSSPERIAEMISTTQKLISKMDVNKASLVNASSEKSFEFARRAITITSQVLEVSTSDNRSYIRDKYMAENTAWIKQWLPYGPIALWAHNYHVMRKPNYNHTIGHYLSNPYKLSVNPQIVYSNIGFSMAKGEVFARFSDSETSENSLKINSISADPLYGSINDFFYASGQDGLMLKMEDLLGVSEEWRMAILNGLKHLEMGATFTGNPEDHYRTLQADFDYLIFLRDTNAAAYIPD